MRPDLLLVSVLVFGAMAVEARRAGRNERAQRARGGFEPRGDVYTMMQVAYPAAFLAMIVEGAAGWPAPWPRFAAGLAVFGAAKLLKWWAIRALDRAWTFRVIVVPGDPLVRRGPYRFLRHPNYVAVLGELGGTALLTGARVAGLLGPIVFGVLMLKRMAVEEAALGAIRRRGA
jgi:methyltransferase